MSVVAVFPYTEVAAVGTQATRLETITLATSAARMDAVFGPTAPNATKLSSSYGITVEAYGLTSRLAPLGISTDAWTAGTHPGTRFPA